jgi:GDPmannose 4,6-dehydratase
MEAVRSQGLILQTRILQAGTSELFGTSLQARQSESVPFAPTTPYGSSKAMAHYLASNYRRHHCLFVVNAILFNHESPRRGNTFRTYKITQQVAEVVTGKRSFVNIGNPETRRDWGHVKDFVRAMWLSLQHVRSDDYVFGTGTSHSLRDFVNASFASAGVGLDWHGNASTEVAVNKQNGQIVVRIDEEEYNRESHNTEADPTKLKQTLCWSPEISFEVTQTDARWYSKLTRTGNGRRNDRSCIPAVRARE